MPKCVKDQAEDMENINSLRNVSDTEKQNLESSCHQWKRVLEEGVPEDAAGHILLAVGQANLLVREKFKQFEELLSIGEHGPKNGKTVTISDLTAYWDIMLVQVDDIKKKFRVLEKMKESNWKVEPEPTNVKENLKSETPGTCRLKKKSVPKHISVEAKMRLAEVKARLKKWTKADGCVSDIEFEASKNEKTSQAPDFLAQTTTGESGLFTSPSL